MTEEVKLPTYETLLTEAIRSLAVDSGVVSSPVSAGGNALTDSTKGWAAGVHKNRLVKIIRGAGAGQLKIIDGNSPDSLVIKGAWPQGIGAGAVYVILEKDLAQILRNVFGGGSDISAANPLHVDTSPGLKTATTVLDEATIAAGATTALADCTAIDLSDGEHTLAITIEATYNGAATQGIKIHVRTSYDGANFDTEDWDSWTPSFTAGATIRQTKHYDVSPYAIKVLVENLDPAQTVTGVKVIATVGS